MTSEGYVISLLNRLCKFTHGKDGVSVVSEYILQNWYLFVHKFDYFCRGLVRHCLVVCKKRGDTYLSHRESLHTSKSGWPLVRTLSQRSARVALQSAAQAIVSYIAFLVFLEDWGVVNLLLCDLLVFASRPGCGRFGRWPIESCFIVPLLACRRLGYAGLASATC